MNDLHDVLLWIGGSASAMAGLALYDHLLRPWLDRRAGQVEEHYGRHVYGGGPSCVLGGCDARNRRYRAEDPRELTVLGEHPAVTAEQVN